jgi:hypothetical protein
LGLLSDKQPFGYAGFPNPRKHEPATWVNGSRHILSNRSYTHGHPKKIDAGSRTANQDATMDQIMHLLVRAANVELDENSAPLPPDVAAQDKGPGIIITVLSLTSIMTLFVAVRLYTRVRVLGATHLDDWLIIASMVCTWAAAGFAVTANLKGAGRHVRALNKQQLHDSIFFVMTGFVPSLLSFAFPKLAIVALLTRLMNPSRIHRRFLWCLAGSCFVVLCANIIVMFSQCNPVSSLWDKTIKEGQKVCWDPRVNKYTAYFAGGQHYTPNKARMPVTPVHH